MSLRTKNKRAAEIKKAQLEVAFAAGTWDPWKDSLSRDRVTIYEAQREFLRRRKDDGIIGPATARRYKHLFGTLNAKLPAGILLSQVEARHLKPVLRNPELTGTTPHSYKRSLRAFFQWCLAEGMLRRNPVEEVHLRKPPETLPAYLTQSNYARLLRVIRTAGHRKRDGANMFQWLEDIVVVAVGTGFRRGELIHLRWSAVDLENGYIHVRCTDEFTAKNKKERPVPLAGEALRVFRRLSAERTSVIDDYVFHGRRGGKLCGQFLTNRFKHFAVATGLRDEITFHSCRHTFASWLAMAGVDIVRIKELLGHASIKQTMVYVHLLACDARPAMERVFGSASAYPGGDGAASEAIARFPDEPTAPAEEVRK